MTGLHAYNFIHGFHPQKASGPTGASGPTSLTPKAMVRSPVILSEEEVSNLNSVMSIFMSSIVPGKSLTNYQVMILCSLPIQKSTRDKFNVNLGINISPTGPTGPIK